MQLAHVIWTTLTNRSIVLIPPVLPRTLRNSKDLHVLFQPLVKEFGDCRIMYFKHDTAFGMKPGNTNSRPEEAARALWSGFIEHGNTLLFELLALRSRESQHIPIIFLSISSGGFALKQVTVVFLSYISQTDNV